MPVLFYQKETEKKARIMTIHYQPHLLNEEKKKKTIEIDEMPIKPEVKRGEKALPYVNPQTKEVWWEVVERPLSTEEKRDEEMEDLKRRVEKLENKSQ